MDRHLLKPLAARDLEQALSQVFEGRPAADAAASMDDANASFRLDFVSRFGADATERFIDLALKQLVGRLANQTREALAEDAHKIAGSAGMVGERRLGQLALALETACETGGELEPALASARLELADATKRLERWATVLQAERLAA